MKKLVALAGVVALAGGPLLISAQGRAATPEVVTMMAFPGDHGGLIGSDGKHHDTMVPANVVLKKGVPVTLRVVNYDDMVHSVTAPGLGLNLIAAPGKDVGDNVVPVTTTVTFTPTATGEFRWHCMGPCDPWSMTASFDGPDRNGYMAGYFMVMD